MTEIAKVVEEHRKEIDDTLEEGAWLRVFTHDFQGEDGKEYYVNLFRNSDYTRFYEVFDCKGEDTLPVVDYYSRDRLESFYPGITERIIPKVPNKISSETIDRIRESYCRYAMLKSEGQ